MQSASFHAPQRASTGGGNMTPGHPPTPLPNTHTHLPVLPLLASFPPSLVYFPHSVFSSHTDCFI